MPADPFPTLKPGYRLDAGTLVSPAGERVGRYEPGERRAMWDFARLGASPELQRAAQAEAARWDEWSSDRQGELGLLRDPTRLSLAKWFRHFPHFAEALGEIGVSLDLGGRNALNIGGTGQDLVYWLGEHPLHIDHVEVSPRSQAWCARKIAHYEEATGETVPIAFHTIPAEHLPFADASFDFVFARSTIHHCVRPAVSDEILRVLKPGGVLLLSEFFLNDALYALMRADRFVRRRDRGSDDPLRPFELRHFEERIAARGGRSARVYTKPLHSMLRPSARGRRATLATALSVVFAATG